MSTFIGILKEFNHNTIKAVENFRQLDDYAYRSFSTTEYYINKIDEDEKVLQHKINLMSLYDLMFMAFKRKIDGYLPNSVELIFYFLLVDLRTILYYRADQPGSEIKKYKKALKRFYKRTKTFEKWSKL